MWSLTSQALRHKKKSLTTHVKHIKFYLFRDYIKNVRSRTSQALREKSNLWLVRDHGAWLMENNAISASKLKLKLRWVELRLSLAKSQNQTSEYISEYTQHHELNQKAMKTPSWCNIAGSELEPSASLDWHLIRCHCSANAIIELSY